MLGVCHRPTGYRCWLRGQAARRLDHRGRDRRPTVLVSRCGVVGAGRVCGRIGGSVCSGRGRRSGERLLRGVRSRPCSGLVTGLALLPPVSPGSGLSWLRTHFSKLRMTVDYTRVIRGSRIIRLGRATVSRVRRSGFPLCHSHTVPDQCPPNGQRQYQPRTDRTSQGSRHSSDSAATNGRCGGADGL